MKGDCFINMTYFFAKFKFKKTSQNVLMIEYKQWASRKLSLMTRTVTMLHFTSKDIFDRWTIIFSGKLEHRLWHSEMISSCKAQIPRSCRDFVRKTVFETFSYYNNSECAGPGSLRWKCQSQQQRFAQLPALKTVSLTVCLTSLFSWMSRRHAINPLSA